MTDEDNKELIEVLKRMEKQLRDIKRQYLRMLDGVGERVRAFCARVTERPGHSGEGWCQIAGRHPHKFSYH